MKLGEKAQWCLQMAYAMHVVGRTDFWQTLYDEACARWTEKAVNRKFEELSKRGYLDYGVSARMGWLTDKGYDALGTKRRS